MPDDAGYADWLAEKALKVARGRMRPENLRADVVRRFRRKG